MLHPLDEIWRERFLPLPAAQPRLLPDPAPQDHRVPGPARVRGGGGISELHRLGLRTLRPRPEGGHEPGGHLDVVPDRRLAPVPAPRLSGRRRQRRLAAAEHLRRAADLPARGNSGAGHPRHRRGGAVGRGAGATTPVGDGGEGTPLHRRLRLAEVVLPPGANPAAAARLLGLPVHQPRGAQGAEAFRRGPGSGAARG